MQGKLTQIETRIERITQHGEVRLKPSYWLHLDDQVVPVDPHQHLSLSFNYVGGAVCGHCQAPLNRKFGGQYCYTCFTTLARCDLCVMSPDRCHLHLGTCREPDWGESFCQQPHLVYVAISSGPKVGITRYERLERRWVDQGAQRAMAIAQVPTRRAAGVLEASLRRHVSDRTDWRKMVTGNTHDADLFELARQLRAIVPDLSAIVSENLPLAEATQMHWLEDPDEVCIDYPLVAHAPAHKLKVNQFAPRLADDLLGFIGSHVLLRSGVLPFADVSMGDLSVALEAPLPVRAQPPQLDLF